MSAEENKLLVAWEQVHGRRSAAAAVLDTRGSVQRTFSDIEAEAVMMAAGPLGELRHSCVVGIQLGNHPSWPAVLLACWRRGLVALPLERSISAQEREAALQVCHAGALVLDDAASVTVSQRSHDPVDWGGHVPVLLKLTSGTTAAPRAIRFRSAQLLADCEQICDTMGITAADLNFGVIPVSHSYGFSNLLTPLLARGVPLIMSRDRMPRAVLDDLARAAPVAQRVL